MTCPTCGGPVSPKGPGIPGGPRKYCSENCRKRAWDRRNPDVCVDCGAAMPRSGRPDDRPHERCRPCWKRWVERGQEERIRDAAAMYNEGLPVKEIARQLGYSEGSHAPEVVEARRRGLIGYRYKAYEARA